MARVKFRMVEKDDLGHPTSFTVAYGGEVHPGETYEWDATPHQVQALKDDALFEVLSVSGDESTKADLQARLTELGIEFKPKDNKAKLQQLIDEAEANDNGASEDA